MNEERSARLVAIALFASAVASLSLSAVYILGGQTQLEGVLLGIALGGMGLGLVLWAKAFLPVGGQVQQREPLEPTAEEQHSAEESLEEGLHEIGRRSFLVKVGVAAAASLGLAALFPIRSLGGRPGKELIDTAWRDGLRLVDSNGQPLTADQMTPGQVLTVFPQGHVGAADAVTLLIGLPRGANQPLAGRETWSPDGLIAYSKLCTHAGCPVGLYDPNAMELFCPCHQSVFDVVDGARPVGGPATRPLPQLPLGIDNDGYVIALGGFSGAPGPGFWSRPNDA